MKLMKTMEIIRKTIQDKIFPIFPLPGQYDAPEYVLEVAEQVKHQNNKVNTPSKFQKHPLIAQEHNEVRSWIAERLGVDKEKVDFVYFSASWGAEEHTDLLDPHIFTGVTVILPILVDEQAGAVFHIQEYSLPLEKGKAYMFNHEIPHSITVKEGGHGVVVIMASIKY